MQNTANRTVAWHTVAKFISYRSQISQNRNLICQPFYNFWHSNFGTQYLYHFLSSLFLSSWKYFWKLISIVKGCTYLKLELVFQKNLEFQNHFDETKHSWTWHRYKVLKFGLETTIRLNVKIFWLNVKIVWQFKFQWGISLQDQSQISYNVCESSTAC